MTSTTSTTSTAGPDGAGTDPAPGGGPLPPVAPEVLAEAVESLSARLRKKLDAAVEGCAAAAVAGADGSVTVRFGEDAVVTLRPGPSGVVAEAAQAVCGCLLAPRCLHRAAVLGAAPLADPSELPDTCAAGPGPGLAEAEAGTAPADGGGAGAGVPVGGGAGAAADARSDAESRAGGGAAAGAHDGGGGAGAGSVASGGAAAVPAYGAEPLTRAQLAAGAALWTAAAEALAAGVTAGGAVVQAELLRAAHSARLAGLPHAEAAALRVVRGLRGARERRAGQRLTDLAAAFAELLRVAALLAAGTGGPGVTGGGRRAYAAGGSLRVQGLCREPVLSATGYGGVVTHLLGEDGARYSVSDVRPGGLARARGAGAASVALGGAVLDHAGLARGGLRVVGATVSADGRLGAGRGVRATPVPGLSWAAEPLAALFARPAAQALAAQQADGAPDSEAALLGCDVQVAGAAGDHLLVRELSPDGTVRADAPLLRLCPAHPHPELAHTANLRRLAGYPGLAVRVLGRPDLDRAATLRPLAVGPVPGAEYTLRLPAEWLDRADLGYDRLQGSHFPEGATPGTAAGSCEPGTDPLADSPLWRVRRLLEAGVAGGRRAVAESARGPEPLSAYGPLRRAGFGAAADLAGALVLEADRRPRNSFGRLTEASADAYARAWLAASTHLSAAHRSLVAASWT
ncbi:hypothetical protein ABZZ17_24615 [Streptomyces sp. NPDC006512]|uniref:hypothetical protein n=1 Tax=Streptomyces sp. NPDC006512 TaxID=3154307 RepID=UPI0033AF9E3A